MAICATNDLVASTHLFVPERALRAFVLHAQLDFGCGLIQLGLEGISRSLWTWFVGMQFARTITFPAGTATADWAGKDLRASIGSLVSPSDSSAVWECTFDHKLVFFEIALAKSKIVQAEGISVRISLNNVVVEYL